MSRLDFNGFFLPISTPNFTWGIHSATDFTQIIEATYSEVVHWRPNYFTIPLGKAGKEFVRELSRLFLAFATESSMELIALRAATVLPILLLQKPNRTSKSKEHITFLDRRLRVWKNGDLNELVLESRALQNRLPKTYPPTAKQNLSHSFAKLMFAEKIKAALDLLSNNGEKGGTLHLTDPSDPNI